MAKQESGSAKLNQVLTVLNQNGGFPFSVLTDSQGLPIASAADGEFDADRQSAAAALVQKLAGQVTRQLGMGVIDEIALNDEDGRRLLCRPFQVNGHDLILAIVLSKDANHRRATNRAIADITRTWKQFWEA